MFGFQVGKKKMTHLRSAAQVYWLILLLFFQPKFAENPLFHVL